ncbi:MAG TPA: 2'-5' RNA ligase family protein [Candidatus Saccharimonadales bacterium]|nr:2'-5' RNA ligase family protein [Candidatus Saccharimonadales bacterium]
MLVEPLAVGAEFSRWPLHITIVPWFRLDETSAVIASGLTQALNRIDPFMVAGDGEAMFGPKKTRRVRLLEQSTPLEGIEVKVRNYLHKKHAWLVDETTKNHYDFRPHVTEQGGEFLPAGGTFTCSTLSIIEQLGGKKRVASEVQL